MNTLNQWATRHGVSPQAMQDLYATMGLTETVDLGACEDITGRQIRYGLGNDSSQINKVFKSSDLIGITPHVVVPADVGLRLGVFTSIEVKRGGWSYKGTERETAQFRWLK